MHVVYIVNEDTGREPDDTGNRPGTGQFAASNLFIMYGGKMTNEFVDGQDNSGAINPSMKIFVTLENDQIIDTKGLSNKL